MWENSLEYIYWYYRSVRSTEWRWWPLTFVMLFSIEWTKIDVIFVSVGRNDRKLLNSLELGPSPHVSSLLWKNSCFFISNYILVKTFLNVNTTMWSRTRMIIFFLQDFVFLPRSHLSYFLRVLVWTSLKDGNIVYNL